MKKTLTAVLLLLSSITLANTNVEYWLECEANSYSRGYHTFLITKPVVGMVQIETGETGSYQPDSNFIQYLYPGDKRPMDGVGRLTAEVPFDSFESGVDYKVIGYMLSGICRLYE